MFVLIEALKSLQTYATVIFIPKLSQVSWECYMWNAQRLLQVGTSTYVNMSIHINIIPMPPDEKRIGLFFQYFESEFPEMFKWI